MRKFGHLTIALPQMCLVVLICELFFHSAKVVRQAVIFCELFATEIWGEAGTKPLCVWEQGAEGGDGRVFLILCYSQISLEK